MSNRDGGTFLIKQDSVSNPATPIPTPISPTPSSASVHCAGSGQQVLPEQLAAGIHRLKVEEGMSSGGSSGFPSTPAPATTPFIQHVAGEKDMYCCAVGVSLVDTSVAFLSSVKVT